MKPLNPDQIQELHALLLDTRLKLERQLQDGAAAADVVVLDQTSVGRVSRMDAMQQQSMAKSTRVNAEASLRKVHAALKRLAEEDYGYCADCDEAIEFKRLRVQPEASRCLRCQSLLDSV